MQLRFPFYPQGTHFISDRLGVYVKDGLAQYIINGLPAYSHPVSDLNSFRYITSNFIHQGLCRKVDIERSFQVSSDSVGRAYKKFVGQGADGFFAGMGVKGLLIK
jgi:hypothetical protein